MRVLFTDTESTDLSASWGRLLCTSSVELGGEPYTYRGDKRPYKGATTVDDSKLAVATRDDWERADCLVTWNGKLHDVPLLNARLALAGERPLRIGAKHGTHHLDLMYYAGGQSMKIGGRRLETVARYFKTDSQKTPLDGETWQLAGTGDRKALDKVVEHCEFDVLVLRDLWPHLAPYVKQWQFNLSDVWEFVGEIKTRKVEVG